MNKYPEYVDINNRQYKINTDFRIALKCSEVATDNSIGDFERALAIVYLLFGDEGLKHGEDYEKLLKFSTWYLACGKKIEKNNDQPDMDFIEDMDYIEASFMSDYNIDLTNENMHWWKFSNLINGLSNSDNGDCCVLNRIRNLRTYDTSKIKDAKERAKIEEAKKSVALKKYKKENNLTKEQEQSMLELNKMLGI